MKQKQAYVPKGRRRRFGLSGKLMVAFLALAVGPALFLGTVLPWRSYVTQRDAAMELQDYVARTLSNRIEAHFARAVDATRQTEAEIAIYGLEGAEARMRLYQLLDTASLARITLIDHRGTVIAQAHATDVLPDEISPDTIRLAASAGDHGDFVMGAVRYDAMTAEPVVPVAVPSNTGTGAQSLVAVVEVRLQPVWEMVAELWRAGHINAMLLDGDGAVLAHRNPSVVLSGVRHEPAPQTGLVPGSNGDMAVVVHRPVRIGGTELRVVAERAARDALALAVREALVIGVLLLSGVAVAVLLVAMARRRIVRPLSALTDAAHDIAAGHLDRRSDGAGNDELGDLSRAFNEMAARSQDLVLNLSREVEARRTAQEDLAALNRELERRVEDRTARLRDSEGRIRAIMHSVADAIVVVDGEGIIETFNPAAERMFAQDAERLHGTRIDAHLPLGAWRPNSGGTGVREVLLHQGGGGRLPVELAISEVTTDQGRRYIGLFHDISERKVAEDRLRRAKDAADEANRAKSDFLSRMSHELRTPLNAILGFGQFLQIDPRERLSETQNENVSLILRAGTHLLDLINEILDLAKIESGRVTLSIESLALAPLAEECMRLVAPQADAAGIRLIDETADADGLAPVWADRVRLKQVLVNLLSNAVKYNRPGGTVHLRARSADDGMIRLAVTDTGHGIPEEQLPQLFEPFARLDAEDSDIEGSGIGLTITRKLVAMMGGNIGVESVLGEGTTFTVALPCSDDCTRDACADKPCAENRASLSGHLGQTPRTVLYVEDNPATLRLMQRLLGGFDNVTLLTATTAEAGLALVEERPIDLVIMDVNLPGMDGLEAVRRLKSNPAAIDIPVIVVSATSLSEDVEMVRRLGISCFLTKPLDVTYLTEIIVRLLGGTAVAGPGNGRNAAG